VLRGRLLRSELVGRFARRQNNLIRFRHRSVGKYLMNATMRILIGESAWTSRSRVVTPGSPTRRGRIGRPRQLKLPWDRGISGPCRPHTVVGSPLDDAHRGRDGDLNGLAPFGPTVAETEQTRQGPRMRTAVGEPC